MWTGTAALKNIDQALQTIRNDVVRLDNQLSQLSGSIAVNKRHRVRLISDIAKVRLSEIESGQLQADMTAADNQVLPILQQRETALHALNAELEQHNQQLQHAEAERDDLLDRANIGSQQLVDIEANVQASLKNDSDYMAQFAKASEAGSVSAEAEVKVEQAQQDMAEKAKPYQKDQLFIYLWERGYGTTKYEGGLFARFMDGWVARVIKYESARVNFWNLMEIPKRLTEHADRVAEIAEEQRMQLQQLELEALDAAGANSLTDRLQQLRDELDQHDDRLELAEATLNEKLSQRAKFIAGEDEYIQRCLTRLSQALDHQDLAEVHRYVQATHSPTDDQLVLELQSLDDRLEDVAEDLTDLRGMHDAKLSRLKELEDVRRNFKNSRYDDVRSGFGNQALITSVLGQFLQGAVSGSDVWRAIKRNQRYRNVGSVPDFGSDGMDSLGDIFGGGSLGGVGGGRVGRRKPSARRQSTWNWPQPRRGGGGFRIPRGGGKSSGGFKTGGGF
jgi:hypothetical protein